MKNKTMKVIDLLNLVYEGKAPKKVKYDGNIYTYSDYRYRTDDGWLGFLETKNMFCSDVLNYEVEVLEDKPKKIDEIDMVDNFTGLFDNTPMTEQLELNFQQVNGKFNELTKAVNYLLEKSEDNDS